ncbi:MAG: Imm21 family immunity protein [Kibdelosporangium sp.]
MNVPSDAWLPCGLDSMSCEQMADYVEAVRATVPDRSGHGSDEAGAWWFTSGHQALTTMLWVRADCPSLSYAVAGEPDAVKAERSRWDRVITEADRSLLFGGGGGGALSSSLRIANDSPHDERTWVSAVDGSLAVLPAGWTGSGVEIPAGLAGVVEVGDARALVLVGRGATCYLPAHRLFVRWLAADSQAELIESAITVFEDPATEWEACGSWEVGGPVILADPVFPGLRQAPVLIRAGRWTVHAAAAGLVRLRHAEQP